MMILSNHSKIDAIIQKQTKKKKQKKKPLTDSNAKNDFTVLSLILAEKKDASAKFITRRGD